MLKTFMFGAIAASITVHALAQEAGAPTPIRPEMEPQGQYQDEMRKQTPPHAKAGYKLRHVHKRHLPRHGRKKTPAHKK